ncbi:MAG: rhombosortase [Steroidobacteraceae bacterium]|jgi:rhomboid family GlyGly-CTERM serine protease
MLGDAADRLSQAIAALQLDRGRWVWLLLILLALCVVLGLGDSVSELLRYDRGAIAAGGWWRLLTAHVVHLDAHHLVLNALGLILMWSLFASDYDAIEWSIIVLAGALAISSGLWWLSPRVAWYVGASGVLHSVVAAGTAKHLAARIWDRWILLALLGLKLAYEQLGGLEPPLVVVDAHLYGAVCGFAVGAALSWRTAIIRHRS